MMLSLSLFCTDAASQLQYMKHLFYAGGGLVKCIQLDTSTKTVPSH